MKSLLWISLFLLFIQCQEPEQTGKTPELPATPLFTNQSYWGVLSDPYAKILEDKDRPEAVLATCRRGDILEIFEIYREEVEDPLWLRVQYKEMEGWLPRSSLLLFDNPEQAKTASLQMDSRDSDQ